MLRGQRMIQIFVLKYTKKVCSILCHVNTWNYQIHPKYKWLAFSAILPAILHSLHHWKNCLWFTCHWQYACNLNKNKLIPRLSKFWLLESFFRINLVFICLFPGFVVICIKSWSHVLKACINLSGLIKYHQTMPKECL